MSIYALSSAAGRAGVAVIRISGEATHGVLHALCRGQIPAPRVASLRTLRNPHNGEIIDNGLVLWFPAPGSFTGEDMAELHLHGGRAVLAAAFEALSALGLRIAEPGEFTKRAFENGKLDLTEVEGLADLINAETAAQRKQALAQTSGKLRGQYEAWRATLLRAMAFVEASLDFSDEGDIADQAFRQALPEASALLAALDRALDDGRRGEILREGIQVAIIGEPNVGKSSLFNALAGRDAAIVFDEPGTTRDIIEVTLDLDGYPFVLRDTAGLRNAASAVEREGIRRAYASAAAADIVLAMSDASAAPQAVKIFLSFANELESEGPDGNRIVIPVMNKIDLVPHAGRNESKGVIAISAKTGEGLGALKTKLIAIAKANYDAAAAPLITRARHRQELERTRAALQAFLDAASTDAHPELAAEHLREAADALGRLTGRLDVEDVLGQIFSEFCVGK